MSSRQLTLCLNINVHSMYKVFVFIPNFIENYTFLLDGDEQGYTMFLFFGGGQT